MFLAGQSGFCLLEGFSLQFRDKPHQIRLDTGVKLFQKKTEELPDTFSGRPKLLKSRLKVGLCLGVCRLVNPARERLERGPAEQFVETGHYLAHTFFTLKGRFFQDIGGGAGLFRGFFRLSLLCKIGNFPMSFSVIAYLDALLAILIALDMLHNSRL